MDNTLMVKNMDGVDIKINVIDIIEDTETNKEYICYSVDGFDSVFISNLVQTDEGYSLEEVTDEERDNVEAVLKESIEA